MDSAEQEQDIVVKIAKNFKDIDISLPKLEKLAKAVCNRFTKYETRATQRSVASQSSIRDIHPPKQRFCGGRTRYEISIAIVDDAEIRRVNKQFLNSDSTADCLSFDLSDDNTNEIENRKSFELVVNAEAAVKEAKLRGHSSEAELALYITHSLLHNLGFDDSTQSQAQKMHDTEDKILQQFGYGVVYNKSIRA